MPNRRAWVESVRINNSPNGKYRYKYLYKCRVCDKTYWSKAWYKSQPRCKSCAGRETYTPSKVEPKNIRRRGDGYITKQGYHLIYDGKRYVPAHRLAFPGLSSNMVVHHIDGDKLNNMRENLIAMTKAEHRKCHGDLENVSYLLIRAGLIVFEPETRSYSLSSSMKKLMELISVNSEKPLTGGAEGNSEPSPKWGRCNDYPIEEYARSLVEARNTPSRSGGGEDIVSSA